MLRRILGTTLGCAAVGVVVSCADGSPRSPITPEAASPSRASAPAPRGSIGFRCVLGYRDAGTGHWQKRPATVYFPHPETTTALPLLPYRYEVLGGDGKLLRFAQCQIPRTESAIRRMDRISGVGKPGVERIILGSSPLRAEPACTQDYCPIDGLVVKATPVPDAAPEEDGWGWDWDDTGPCTWSWCGGGGGGGDGGGTPPDSTAECDPAVDPNCLRPLFADDTVSIRRALARYRRSPTEFTDSIARRECEEMYTEFERLYRAGEVYRGNSSTGHYGQALDGSIHFDPSWLNAANAGDTVALKEIAVTAHHEAAHALGRTHGDPMWVGPIDQYGDPYFNRLTPGANACVKR